MIWKFPVYVNAKTGIEFKIQPTGLSRYPPQLENAPNEIAFLQIRTTMTPKSDRISFCLPMDDFFINTLNKIADIFLQTRKF